MTATSFDLAAFVAAFTKAQGLPEKVEDEETLRLAAAWLLAAQHPGRQKAAG